MHKMIDPTMADVQPTHWPPGHPPVKFGRIGVLLLNLGTPDATDYWSMRRYLKQFLSDRRVIEVLFRKLRRGSKHFDGTFLFVSGRRVAAEHAEC